MNLKAILILLLLIIVGTSCKNDTQVNSQPKSIETEVSSEEIAKPDDLTEEDQVNEIKAMFQNIENNLSNFKKKSTVLNEDWGEKEIIGYYDESVLKKLIISNSSEHSTNSESLYFNEEAEIFFVHSLNLNEATFNGPYTKTEYRAYIQFGGLIKMLKKEHVFTEADNMDMSNIQNVDMTNEFGNSSAVIEGYYRDSENAISALEQKDSGFVNSIWTDTEDTNSMIEIKDGKWIHSYKGTETDPGSVYNFSVKKNEETGDKLLTLTNDYDTMKYSIAEQSENTLSLIYLDRGNMLTYKRVTSNLSPFVDFPSEIYGCSCYYSYNEDAFAKRNYIYIDNYEKSAFIIHNGVKTKFSLSTTESPAEDEVIQVWTNTSGLTLRLELLDVGQVDETYQKSGTLKLSSSEEIMFKTEIYGECGC